MSVYVRPKSAGASHHISLQGGGRIWGIKLKRGAKSIVESALTPTNLVKGAGGGKRFGDFDPSFAHIEMRDWSGGRGNEYFSDDPSKYYDGYGWTLTPGVWHQAPQWSFGEMSTLSGDIAMPGANRHKAGNSVSFWNLIQNYPRARAFMQSSKAYDIKRAQIWVRRIGVPPGPLYLHVSTISNSSAQPDIASTYSSALFTDSSNWRGVTTATTNVVKLESSACEELESFIWNATLTSAVVADGTTTKHIWTHVFTSGNETYQTGRGTQSNHWELGYYSSASDTSTHPSTSFSAYSRGHWSDVTWDQSRIHFYFRTAPAKADRNWRMFEMERALYAVSQDADGSQSVVYINGERGQHSSAVTGTTDAFHCNTISSDATQFIGGTMAIIYGTGYGQESVISTIVASSGADGGAKFGVSWDKAPSTDSEMVIYDTNEWTRVSTTITSSATSTHVVRDVTVGNSVAHFVLGTGSTFIGSFYWNSSVHVALQSTVGANLDVIEFYHDQTDGPTLYTGRSSIGQVYRAAAPTKGSTIVFTTVSIKCGAGEYPFTNLQGHGGAMYAGKEDSLWSIRKDVSEKVNVGLDAFPSSNNCRSMFSQNLLLHFSWSFSLERLYQGTVDDIGPWRGAGLKPGHEGPISASVPVIAWSFHGIDAGSTDGRSAVMAWDGQRGWHEIHRAYDGGYRIQNIHFQSNPEARPRLWISEGGELISMQFPKDTLNPRSDKNLHFQHEGVLETATIDMGATQLKKLFYSIDAHTKNLASSVARIFTEYQLDDDIGSSNWISIGQFYRSPQDELFIRRGNKHAIRFRFRALTENSTVPAELHAATLKAVGRTPIKRLWNVEAKIGDFQVDSQGLKDADPDAFYKWLRDMAENNQPLLMRSVWAAMDNIYVFSEHPTVNRSFTTPEGQWGGSLRIAIREI